MGEISNETNKIAEQILDAAFIVHRELGPGLLESVYEICLEKLLLENGLNVERQKTLPVKFRGQVIDSGLRPDLIINNQVIVELKAVEKMIPLYDAQLLTYLKLTPINLGLLLNFNTRLLKNGIKRLIYTQDS